MYFKLCYVFVQLCLVDTENGTVEPPEELPPLPHYSEIVEEITLLCKRYNIKLQQEGSRTPERGNSNKHDSDSGKMLRSYMTCHSVSHCALISKQGMLTLELSSYVFEIPDDAYTTHIQNLIGCSILSLEYCKLIG